MAIFVQSIFLCKGEQKGTKIIDDVSHRSPGTCDWATRRFGEVRDGLFVSMAALPKLHLLAAHVSIQ